MKEDAPLGRLLFYRTLQIIAIFKLYIPILHMQFLNILSPSFYVF